MQVKKLGYILFVGVIATICILSVAVMPWQTEKAVGNEQLASFPELRKEDGSFNTGILNEFSDYFADHFGLRHEMITLNDQLTGTVLKTLDSSSVLLGKDDWLFYKSTLADYTLYSPAELCGRSCTGSDAGILRRERHWVLLYHRTQ